MLTAPSGQACPLMAQACVSMLQSCALLPAWLARVQAASDSIGPEPDWSVDLGYSHKPPSGCDGLCRHDPNPAEATGAGEEGEAMRERSGSIDAVHQARGVEEGVDLVDQLLDVERNLDGLFDIAAVGAGISRSSDAGGLVKPLAHFGEMRLQCCFE